MSNEVLAQVGGILSYSTPGHRKICGQVIGENGAGDFCVVFLGPPEQAQDAARQYIRQLEQQGHRLTSVVFCCNDESAGYRSISVVDVRRDVDAGLPSIEDLHALKINLTDGRPSEEVIAELRGRRYER